MAISNFTHAQRSGQAGDAIGTAASIRVERFPYVQGYRYEATGSRTDLIAAGLVASDWFPQGRKRLASGDDVGGTGAGHMFWGITKRAGDCFELKIWNATAEQCKLLDQLLPAEPIVPPTPEEVAREQAEMVAFWGNNIELTWRLASEGKAFRLSERDQERFLEALRAARAILNTATIVNVKQEQAALSVARRDQTFQQFMLDQGLRDHRAEA